MLLFSAIGRTRILGEGQKNTHMVRLNFEIASPPDNRTSAVWEGAYFFILPISSFFNNCGEEAIEPKNVGGGTHAPFAPPEYAPGAGQYRSCNINIDCRVSIDCLKAPFLYTVLK